jgi:hypothetical protein
MADGASFFSFGEVGASSDRLRPPVVGEVLRALGRELRALGGGGGGGVRGARLSGGLLAAGAAIPSFRSFRGPKIGQTHTRIAHTDIT